MPKLTELKGAENLPGKKDFKGYPDVGDTNAAYMFYEDKGHNTAVSQMESCGIKVNVEKLAKSIFLHKQRIFNDTIKIEANKDYGMWEGMGTPHKSSYIQQAEALAASAGEYLEIEVIK